MKMNKKIMISGLVMITIIFVGTMISGYITSPGNKEQNKLSIYSLEYNPEIILPEVFIGESSIWGSELNFSKWSYGPFIETYLEKYSNHSKEVLEIMKMQVL